MPPISSDDQAKVRQQLRRQLRQRRRALSPLQQKRAALRLASQLLQVPAVMRAKNIAVYLPNDGEIDPAFFIILAQRLGKTCYLPVLHPILGHRLWFSRYTPQTRLHHNRFGIPEPHKPQNRDRRAPWALDVVLLPLVGFDTNGGRLGMGGGFYDRTFAYTRHHVGPRPRLIGLAHALQQVELLPLASWDIPLEAVVTDAGVHDSNGRGMTMLRANDAMTGRHRLRERLRKQLDTQQIRQLQKRLDEKIRRED